MRKTLLIALTLSILAPVVNSETFPDAPYVSATQARPHLTMRPTRITSDPFAGDANTVHNTPNRHKQWWGARHPRILGLLIVGAGAGTGAGIALSHRRGICVGTYEGQPYYGTSPCPRDK